MTSKVEYQIIPAGSDDPAAHPRDPRVRIGGRVYPLHTIGGQELSEFDGRQQGFILRGDYGPVVAAYAAACLEAGMPCRLGWHGVINALGDMAEVTTPPPIAEGR